MTLDQPKGLFPLRDDVLEDEHRDEYWQYMKTFFLRLTELNINIYILERLVAFPYDLLAEGRTDDGFFFPLIIKNTLEACILMITKVATDGGLDVFTLPNLKNKLSRMVKPELEPEITPGLKELKFDQKTKDLLEKADKIRDSRIGHFLSKPSEEMTLIMALGI